MSLEVRQHQQRVVVHNVLADQIFLQRKRIRDLKPQIRAFRVQNVDRKVLCPAVAFHQLFMLLRCVPFAGIRRIALDHRSAERINDRLPDLGMKVVLVSLLTGVHLCRDPALERRIQDAQHLQHLFRRDRSCEINLGLHTRILLHQLCSVCRHSCRRRCTMAVSAGQSGSFAASSAVTQRMSRCSSR